MAAPNGDPARTQQQQQEHPPPPSQFPPPHPPAPATQTLNPRPPIPAVGQQTAASNKRKIDNGDFRDSIYFKIRTIVKDLRPHFVDVLHTSDFQNSKATPEVKKRVKLILELSRQLRVGTSSPVKKHHTDPRPTSKVSNPSNTTVENPIATASTVPPESEKTSKPSARIPEAPVAKIMKAKDIASPEAPVAKKFEAKDIASPEAPVAKKFEAKDIASPEAPVAKIFEAKDIEQKLQGLSGTYVVGGSPLGWNFVVYTGSEPAYSGVTKASFKSRLSCQTSSGPASS